MASSLPDAEEFVAGEVFLRFDSEESFHTYATTHGISSSDWEGSGWYRQVTREKSYGCGCCYEHTQHLEPASWIAAEWKKKAQGYLKRVADLARELQEPSLLD